MSKFADLGVRVLSALVMAAIGLSAIWMGGLAFLLLLVAVVGLMIWELTRMLAPELGPVKTALVGVIAASGMARIGFDVSAFALGGLLLAPVLGLVLVSAHRTVYAVYAVAIVFAVAVLFWFRVKLGLDWTIWLVLVVIASDVGGYFFGRFIGGRKIAPKISPKKTWSGTIGGWILAAVVGAAFMVQHHLGASIVVLSVLVAVAAQIGDMVESAVKRLAGVKDSSALIPGHGGLLDRFDALIGAVLLVFLVALTTGLPTAGAL